jgi:N-acetylglutamate synthase-like GNAT family acetyltransferase
MRMAFGTFLRAREPLKVLGDSDYVRSRFLAEPGWGYVAECDGEVVGSSFATRWGSFGLLGPISVRHDLWGRGIARPLLAPLMDLFDTWQVREAGLSTFPNSPKHIGLYQTYGFWPQQLTALLCRVVPSTSGTCPEFTTYGTLATEDRPAIRSASQALTGAILDGLDLSVEIDKAESQGLGDTVLVHAGTELAGIAVCHCGAGEARAASDCLIKFAAVRPAPDAAEQFEALVGACEQLARQRGLERVSACVSTGRADAYRRLLARGYRAQIHGVDMIRPNTQEFLRPDAYVIHDLR